jgi:hypothetical protein
MGLLIVTVSMIRSSRRLAGGYLRFRLRLLTRLWRLWGLILLG